MSKVAIGPHINDTMTTSRIMWAVTLSLIPAGIAGVYIFGLHALFVTVAAVIAAVLTEALFLYIIKKDVKTVLDGSAALTGLLVAYNIPPEVPLWIPVAGSVFAIAVAKQLFGGLGQNIFNPALAGRAFLMISWPTHMTTWTNPRWQVDAVTTATPLNLFKQGQFDLLSKVTNMDLFLGNRGGCIGEVCVAALLIGAVYLLIAGYITWHIPVVYILTVAVFSWIFNGTSGFFTGDVLFFVLSGGLILGAFFMATDYVTSPLTSKGKIIFAAGCGILTFVIRKFAGYPEGVSYAILLMNAAAPLIDRYTVPKWLGYVKK